VEVATPATFSLTNAAQLAAASVPTLSTWGLLALPLLLLTLGCYESSAHIGKITVKVRP
jgi:hypothetical protein